MTAPLPPFLPFLHRHFFSPDAVSENPLHLVFEFASPNTAVERTATAGHSRCSAALPLTTFARSVCAQPPPSLTFCSLGDFARFQS